MDAKLPSQLVDLVKSLGSPRILVVGDLMVDKYVWGTVERTSPEAPIPVLNVTSEEVRPGGSANVVNNLLTLGAQVACCGVVGRDPEGEQLKQRLADMGVDVSGVVKVKDRPTTVKVRLLGHVETATRAVQQLLRVDYERRHDLDADAEQRICEAIERQMDGLEVVLAQDMAKGVCTSRVLRTAIEGARRAGVDVLVDPRRDGRFADYAGATAITPNRMEAQQATGVTLDTMDHVREAAAKLLEELDLENVVITLDRDGAYYYPREGTPQHIATQPRDVYDVTGAGDMVVSMIAFACACGAAFEDALALGNVAAGIEVGKVGCVPVTKQEIIEALAGSAYVPTTKLRTLEQLLPEINERRRRGEVCAFTNGCFDILHPGHINTIKFARSQGDFLVVGMNSDWSIRQQKGPNRPFLNQDERANILSAIHEVDYVVVFNEVSVLPLIEKIRPDVLVKGGDVGEAGVVGQDFVESYGGRVALAPVLDGVSTTDIAARVLKSYQDPAQIEFDKERMRREAERRAKKRRKSE